VDEAGSQWVVADGGGKKKVETAVDGRPGAKEDDVKRGRELLQLINPSSAPYARTAREKSAVKSLLAVRL